MADIQRITGKGHSVIYGHMTLLRAKGALRWRSIENGTLVVSFDTDDSGFPEFYSEKPELNSGKPERAVDTPLTLNTTFNSVIPLNNLPTNNDITVGVNVVGNSGKPESTPKNRNSRSDPRSKSPAIQCVKGVTGKYPPLALYDDVIRVLGDSPDGKRLADCHKAWIARGYNPNGYSWLLEWYISGIPERSGSKAQPRKGYNPDVFEKLRKEKANGRT